MTKEAVKKFRKKCGDNRLKRITRFLYKWLWCSWKHRREKCYPRVDIPEGAPGSNYWHCTKCHPCGEVFDLISGDKKSGWF